MTQLADVQYTKPKHEIRINRVGITEFKLPIYIAQKNGSVQHSVASIECYVDLAAEIKGINMSRLAVGLQKFSSQQLCGKLIKEICEYIRFVSDNSETCEIIYQFDYFIEKIAPKSKEPGLLPYNIIFKGIKTETDFIFKLSVETIATSCCPCSKEISDNSAHNQKCYITIECEMNPDEFLWIEDLVKIAESSASCEIFSVLKRADEKVVTEEMYNNSKFVEDIARECYSKLDELNIIKSFSVKVESDESIHAHKAVAFITN
jgi:GTP cyclohydrolase I